MNSMSGKTTTVSTGKILEFNDCTHINIEAEVKDMHLLCRELSEIGYEHSLFLNNRLLIKLNLNEKPSVLCIFYGDKEENRQILSTIKEKLLALKTSSPVKTAVSPGDLNDWPAGGITEIPFRAKLSSVVVSALASEEISPEFDMINTLAYYLNMLLLKELLEVHSIPLSFVLLSRYMLTYRECDKTEQDRIDCKILENQGRLKEIKTDIFENIGVDSISWFQAAKELLVKEIRARKYDRPDASYRSIADSVDDCLGMNKENNLLIRAFILSQFVNEYRNL